MTLEKTPQGHFVDGLRVSPDVFARYKAARDRKLVQLAAAAPLRGANRTGRAQDDASALDMFNTQGSLPL